MLRHFLGGSRYAGQCARRSRSGYPGRVWNRPQGPKACSDDDRDRSGAGGIGEPSHYDGFFDQSASGPPDNLLRDPARLILVRPIFEQSTSRLMR